MEVAAKHCGFSARAHAHAHMRTRTHAHTHTRTHAHMHSPCAEATFPPLATPGNPTLLSPHFHAHFAPQIPFDALCISCGNTEQTSIGLLPLPSPWCKIDAMTMWA